MCPRGGPLPEYLKLLFATKPGIAGGSHGEDCRRLIAEPLRSLTYRLKYPLRDPVPTSGKCA